MDKLIYKLKAGKKLQMICFPYLGGYANSFAKLIDCVNEDVEVWSFNAPGHGGSSEKPLQNIHSLVNLYYQHLHSVIKKPYIFFGHSMGAIVAYFLIQKIVAEGNIIDHPAAIILSACNTPAFFEADDVATLPDKKFIERLKSYDGISDVLLQEKSLINYFLPSYRADFKILKTAALANYMPLDIPVYFLWGDQDKIVPFDEVIRWSNYFSQPINLFFIENGSHMFIDQNVVQVASKIEKIIKTIYKYDVATAT